MNFLKAHRFLKADSPRFSRRDEPEITNEEHSVLVDCFVFDSFQFAGKKRRKRVPKVDCQRRGTDHATVVKLNCIRLIRRSNLTVPLQMRDGIDERGMSPKFNRSARMRGGDDVSSSLFDYAEPVEFQLTDDRGLARTRCACDDEPSQRGFFFCDPLFTLNKRDAPDVRRADLI